MKITDEMLGFNLQSVKVIMKKILMLLTLLALSINADEACDCDSINCIDVSEVLTVDGSYDVDAMRVTLMGTLSSKKVQHPVKGEIITPTLIIEPTTCIYGNFTREDDSILHEEYISRIMREIQISYSDIKLINSHKLNKTKQVTLDGYISLTYNANHTTPPFLFTVIDK